MPLLITKADFTGIVDIANHCDLGKLEISIKQATTFDLEELFCDFWNAVVENWEDPAYQTLINGGEYEGCNGKRNFAGIKTILVYYSYSRYLFVNRLNDTPSGSVSKTNDFSIPTPIKEIELTADQYRTMGYKEYLKAQAYLCRNSETFTDFNTGECKPCGCNGICGSKTSAKGYGISGSIISKNL